MLLKLESALESKKDFASLFLRIGLAVIFLWFGIDKFFNPSVWANFVPEWMLPLIIINMTVFIYIQGAIEAIIGALLIVGYKTRIAALAAAVTLFVILISVGLNDIGLRDFGLLCAAITLSLLGSNIWSVDASVASRQ